MDDFERYLVVFSMINAAIFYAFTIIVFIMARKSLLNISLAYQKLVWLLIICIIAIPGIARSITWVAPPELRVILWLQLSPAIWLIMYAVYRENWRGQFHEFLHDLWCFISRRCDYPRKD